MKYKAKEPVHLRQKKLKNGNVSLYLDIYHDGKRSYEFLGLYLIPEKSRFDKERNKTTMIQAEAMKAKRVIDFQNGIFGVVKKNEVGTEMLSAVMELMRDQKFPNLRANSKIIYRTMYGHVMEFGDVQIGRIDREWLLTFIAWLRRKELADGTIYMYFERMAQIFKFAVRKGFIIRNPISLLSADEKPKRPKTEICYLTIEELEAMYATESNMPYLWKMVFLFACFTGLRWSDVSSLRWSDISFLGRPVIDKKQVKTSVRVFIPLSDNALAFLPEKPEDASPEDLVFEGLPTYQSILTFLKKWAIAAGVTKKVTFHVARHTAATLWLTYGAELYTVSNLLGHTGIQSTMIYAKVTHRLRNKAVDDLPNILDDDINK